MKKCSAVSSNTFGGKQRIHHVGKYKGQAKIDVGNFSSRMPPAQKTALHRAVQRQ